MMSFIQKLPNFLIFTVFLAPLVFYPAGMQVFEVPKQFFAVLIINLILLSGIIIFFRKKWELHFNSYVLLSVCLLFFSLLLSAVFSISPVESFFGSFERGQGFFTQIFYILYFLILLNFLQKKENREKSIFVLVVVGTLLSLIAILQVAGFDITGINNLAQSSLRPFSTMGQPNLLGQWLLVPILGMHFLLMDKKSVKSHKYAIYFLLFINYSGLILTQNKASFLGLAVGLILAHSLSGKISGKFKKTYLLIPVLLLLILTGALLINSRSMSSRILLWSGAVETSMENPLFGHGQETFYISAQKNLDPKVYIYEDLFTMPDRTHNFFLQTLHDYGITGLLIQIALGVFLIFSFIKNRNANNIFPFAALTASFISLLFGFSLTANSLLICFLLALFVVNTFRFNRFELKPLYGKIIVLIVTIFFASASVFHQIRTVAANNNFAEAMSIFTSDNDKARENFLSILDADPPFRNINYSIITLLSDKYDPQMERGLERLKIITNSNFQYYIAEAQINASKGDLDKTYESLDNAAQLAPDYVLIYQLRGEIAYRNNDYVEAVKRLNTVIKLAPPFLMKEHVTDEASRELNRIFWKNHPEFTHIFEMLVDSYKKIGQSNRADEFIGSVYIPEGY